MKKTILTSVGLSLFIMLQAQNSDVVKLQVNAEKQIGTAKLEFNGTNIEDLNNQTNGGLFSQLIHGEAFEENVDIDFLNLPVADYVKVHVILDERRLPHFFSVANAYTRPTWNNLTQKYDFNSKDIYSMVNPEPPAQVAGQPEVVQRPMRPMRIGPLSFYGRFMTYDSIPSAIRNELIKRINGKDQISRYWTKILSGNVNYQFELERGDAYMGRQDQIIRFLDGTGELGILNAGLNKQGINLETGKSYDGILRIKSKGSNTLYLSLRDENGKVLAEKPYQLKGDGSWEKVTFELIPAGGTPKGSFGIALKSKGEVELGFAFLQPGEWGRVNGLPVRKYLVDALKKQGITTIRYNGSMVDVGADTYQYRWKKMIGPIDERKIVFRSGFNPYATHTFGLIEMLKVAEALGAQVMLGMSMDENYEDIRDFVEYVNGPVSTKWGALRAEHGHPAPFNLKYIQVDNERRINRGYVEDVKKFAQAAWESDPGMNITMSLNLSNNVKSYSRGTPEYALSSELFGWFVKQGKSERMAWDPHYSGSRNSADQEGYYNIMGITMKQELEKDYPGHTLTLVPMEENGQRCDWDRGLAHAHNWNTNLRNSNSFTWLGTANTIQPHGQHYMWDQGRVHYTSNEVWFQPSAFIDEKISKDWEPVIVEATSSKESVLDVTAKMNEKGDVLSICVVNLNDSAQVASINVAGFKFSSKATTWTIGDCELNTLNTVNNKEAVAPKTGVATIGKKDAGYTFPKYSYTIITLKK
jgi:alpha-L-arabinofuranosidase